MIINKLICNVELDEKTKAAMNRIYDLTGKECYDKYGLTRDERITYSYDFTVGNTKYVADFDTVVPIDEDERVWTQCVIYKVTEDEYIEVTYSECDERVEGEYMFFLDDVNGDNKEYEVTLLVK